MLVLIRLILFILIVFSILWYSIQSTQKQQTNLQRLVLPYLEGSNRTAQKIKIKRTITKQYLIFFDTPELALLKKGISLKYQAIQRKEEEKPTKQLVYQRSDIQTYETKNYKKIKQRLDKHPLFSLVKRSVRQSLIQQLKWDGIPQPLKIKTIFSCAKNNEQITLTDNEEKLTLKLSVYLIQIFYLDFKFETLEVNAVAAGKSIALENIIEALGYNNSVLLTKASKKDYLLLFQYLQSEVSGLKYLIKYPELMALLMAILLSITGLIVMKLLFWRRIFTQKDINNSGK